VSTGRPTPSSRATHTTEYSRAGSCCAVTCAINSTTGSNNNTYPDPHSLLRTVHGWTIIVKNNHLSYGTAPRHHRLLLLANLQCNRKHFLHASHIDVVHAGWMRWSLGCLETVVHHLAFRDVHRTTFHTSLRTALTWTSCIQWSGQEWV